ncbi:hypothetical protein ACQ661_05715 [Pseudidiomarina sp. WS423]|uniref:hypothetical protein n=1 Tax=Pseudidiomarina sp. WS423 TaxID=3425124 RepID=UPI003D6DDDEB
MGKSLVRQILQEMQDDNRLAKSRRNLLAVSSVLIVMTFAGATLTKVNGLIFELTFESPERLLTVLCIATILLTIRYYNHASKYHSAIRERWTKTLVRDQRVLTKCEHSDELDGIAYLIAPGDSGYDDPESSSPTLNFHPRLIFNAEFIYEIDVSHDVITRPVSILALWKEYKSKYFLAIKLTLTYWLDEQLREPDSLFLFSPYLLSIVAVVLYLRT